MAEEFKHIDEIIRQKFDNFEPEPPLHVWENIKSSLPKDPAPPSSPGILLPIIVTISLIIFIAGLFNQYYPDRPDTTAGESSSPYSTVQTAGVAPAGTTSNANLTLPEPAFQAPEIIPSPEEKKVKAEAKKQVPDIPVRAPFGENTKFSRKSKETRTVETTPKLRKEPVAGYRPGIIRAVTLGTITYADAMRYDLTPREIRKLSVIAEKQRNVKPTWSLGAYFNPEMTSYSDESLENSIGFNLAILPTISFSHFYVQSGFNARFTHDKGDYAIDFNRYLGSYEDVYEVTFDSTENGVIPIYHTQTVDVYDTVDHYSISETKATYTYLEVPVLFGYRHSFGRFGIRAQAGPAASFLILKDIPAASVPEENARIVNVNSLIPVRSTINWQLLVGAGFDYELADRVTFSLEPTFRYALDPDFTMPENRNGRTHSFGIRAGLNYRFK
ncbi:MAG: outer membrane beta-barrel protein [Bacteroidales bacterium]|nr:outer membrane beta-barrel protein [Bacteroidales bacterium]